MAGGNADLAYGGVGNDVLTGTDGSDSLFGEEGTTACSSWTMAATGWMVAPVRTSCSAATATTG